MRVGFFFLFFLGCGVCLGVCNPKVEGVKTFANPLRSALKTEMRSESERERGGETLAKPSKSDAGVRSQRQMHCGSEINVSVGLRVGRERDKERESESLSACGGDLFLSLVGLSQSS